MICPICGKRYVPLGAQTHLYNGDYCYGGHLIVTQSTSGTVGPWTHVHDFNIIGEIIASDIHPVEEKKPLEWHEVEKQLDDFMAELNQKRRNDGV